MESLKRIMAIVLIVACIAACKNNRSNEQDQLLQTNHSQKKSISSQSMRDSLLSKGFEVFDYVDEKRKDTVLMQQYFMAFLKTGHKRDQAPHELEALQEAHLAHLSRMYDLGYADISGPFGDDGPIRGITIYNVPTIGIADSLANLDPMVKAGRLEIEIHPWWAAKGYPLR